MPNQQHSKNKKPKKFKHRQKQVIYKQKQTKETDRVFVHTPNLNDTLSPMWKEIQYSGMRNWDVQRPRHPPNLNIKTHG
jgi:hypothetical protein